jgi:hypothetical protein
MWELWTRARLRVGWYRDSRSAVVRDPRNVASGCGSRSTAVRLPRIIRTSSEYWQRDVAENVIFGQGVVVVEFFDGGYSRRLPWVERPEAAALLDAVAGTLGVGAPHGAGTGRMRAPSRARCVGPRKRRFGDAPHRRSFPVRP